MKKLSGTLPRTRSCFVCGRDNPHGLRLSSRIEGGKVVLDYTTRQADTGYRGIVHGGIGMTLLDEVMTWAAIVATGKVCVAAELTIRLKKAIRAEAALRVEGRVARRTARIILTEGMILDRGGNALMRAEGKYMPLPADRAAFMIEDFVIEPDRIHPDEIIGGTGSSTAG